MINFSAEHFVPNNESIFEKLFFQNLSFVIQPSTVQIEFDVFKKYLLTIKFDLFHLHQVLLQKLQDVENKITAEKA